MSCSNLDRDIFIEIAVHHDRGGADLNLVREGVDYRQKIALSDLELMSGLENLTQARLIRKLGSRYFVSSSAATTLPRTMSGEVSLSRKKWDRFRRTFLES